MALQYDRNAILHEYNPATIQFSLHKYALELAVLGAIAEAQRLMSALFQSKHTTHVNTAMMLGLCNAWHLTGTPPDGIDWKVHRDVDDKNLCVADILKMYVEYMRDEYERLHWDGVDERDRNFDENGLDACLNADGNSHRKADSTTSPEAKTKSQRLVKALDISLRLAQPWVRVDKEESEKTHPEIVTTEELDGRSQAILKQIVERWDANGQLYELGLAEELWPGYLKGILADTFGMNREQLRAKGQELIDIYTERLSMPVSLAREPSTPLREMLEIGEVNTLHGAGNDFWFGWSINGKPDQSCFNDPASEEQIKDLEKRLDIELPHDYKDFLRVTNGFGAGYWSFFNGYYLEPKLWPVEELAWSTDRYYTDLHIELLEELPYEYLKLIPFDSDASPSSQTTNSFHNPLPTFDKVLELSRLDIHHTWLIDPESVKQAVEVYNEIYTRADDEQKQDLQSRIETFAGSKEEFDSWAVKPHWCCVQWAAGGAACQTAWPSFGAYLRQMVDRSGLVMS